MAENRWTKPNRLTKVVSVHLSEGKFGEIAGLKAEFFNDGIPEDRRVSDGDPYWAVCVRTKTGLDAMGTNVEYFTNRESAEESKAKWLATGQFGGVPGIPFRFKEFGANGVSLLLSADDDGHWGMVYESLQNAGVIDESNTTKAHVLEWLGEENAEWMRETFGENWTAAAEFEYCAHHFPKSSLAYLAAQVLFFEFCTDDRFSVGYFVRQLEAIYYGVEALAQGADKTHRKAGKGGGKVSSEKKLQRLEALMIEIERLAGLAEHIAEERIIAQAWDNLGKIRADTPKTPKVRFQYEVELRSLDAFAARYRAVFAGGA